MKFLLIVIFIVTIFGGSSFAQRKTDREQDGLIGAVYKVRLEWTEAGQKRSIARYKHRRLRGQRAISGMRSLWEEAYWRL